MTFDEVTALAETLQALRPGAEFAVDSSGIRWYDQTQTQPTATEIASYVPPPPPATVSSQDLMAQFTAADVATITVALGNEATQAKADLAAARVPAAPLNQLWAALQTQKDPMTVTNPRFLAGWSALVQVLGQARMSAISSALGVTVGP
jgi:hypothetical protein